MADERTDTEKLDEVAKLMDDVFQWAREADELANEHTEDILIKEYRAQARSYLMVGGYLNEILNYGGRYKAHEFFERQRIARESIIRCPVCGNQLGFPLKASEETICGYCAKPIRWDEQAEAWKER